MIARGRAFDLLSRKTHGSVAHDALFRSATEIGVLAAGVVTGAIVARTLGPAGKGVFSTVVLLIGVLGQAAAMGIDEAVVILVPRERLSPRDVFRSTKLVLAIASVAACAAYVVIVSLALPRVPFAAYLGVVGIPCFTLAVLATGALSCGARIPFTSGARLIGRIFGVGALAAFVALGGISLGTAVTTEVAALAIWAAAVWWHLRGRDAWRGTGAAPAIRPVLAVGVPLQLSRLILVLSARFDLVMVSALAGARAAGLYSVALTVAQLGVFPAYTLSFAAWPRMADPSDDQLEFVERVTRTGVTVALATCIGLALLAPLLIPLLFGADFGESISLSWIALVAIPPWTLLLLAGRALSALGHSKVPATTLGTTLCVMLALDALLIPAMGARGAALATIGASLAGVGLCRRIYESRLPGRHFFSHMLPRKQDAVDVARRLRQALRRLSD